MATARMDPRGLGRYANSLVSMVRWRSGSCRMGPPFRVPSGIFFRRSAMANSSGSSDHSGADAYGRQRRRRNSDAPWNSCPGRGQPDSREHRARRRKRSVQRHPFIADVANDRLAFRRTETAFGFAPCRARYRAVTIALFANFVRAVFLVTVAATENISEVSRWHDIAGYTIIALVFVSTMGLAYLLGKAEQQKPNGKRVKLQKSELSEVSVSRATSQPARLPLRSLAPYVAAALCWLLFVEIGIAAWYRAHETNLVSGIRWTVQWPEQAPNFRKLNIDPEIRSVLRFDEGEAAAWTLTPPADLRKVRRRENFRDASEPARANTISCYCTFFAGTPAETARFWRTCTGRMFVCLQAAGPRWQTTGCGIIR